MATNVAQVLDAVNSALTVLKSIANTPGVNMIPYVSTISGAISIIQAAESAGANILPYVTAISNTFGSGVPSDADLAALDKKIAELEAQIDAPLPDAEDGEPG